MAQSMSTSVSEKIDYYFCTKYPPHILSPKILASVSDKIALEESNICQWALQNMNDLEPSSGLAAEPIF